MSWLLVFISGSRTLKQLVFKTYASVSSTASFSTTVNYAGMNVVMLSVVILCAIMLSAIMLSALMLNVSTPFIFIVVPHFKTACFSKLMLASLQQLLS